VGFGLSIDFFPSQTALYNAIVCRGIAALCCRWNIHYDESVQGVANFDGSRVDVFHGSRFRTYTSVTMAMLLEYDSTWLIREMSVAFS
jgi:hypothetical protein